jgi:NAD(P)-dependent dehydrogenase (short-subunit alcohol dehydrogenase family)
MDLREKRCLVTGAGRRLGRAVALALASRGAHVGVHYRSSASGAEEVVRRIREGGGRAEAIRGDLTDPDTRASLVDAVDSRLGRMDVLINNASTFYPTPLADVSEREWDDLMDVNLKAPFFLSRDAGMRMKERGEGAIINVADVAALRPWLDYIPYSAAKSALVALTRGLARALAPEVRVNAVAPGAILLPEGTSDEEARRLESRTPLQSLGTPDDLVAAVLFLLEGARYTTGEVILIDGGRHLV